MEHKVWSLLDKTKFTEEFVPQAEYMYDFIEGIVVTNGYCQSSATGELVSVMKEFFDLWNNYGSETFKILESLVNKRE